jgi:hypothetical protein
MDVQTAAFNVAEDYPGGARALARDIDKNATTFSHQLSETGGAVLGLKTAVKMTKRTKDLRILLAFAADCGQMCVPLPEALDLEGSDCMRKLSETSREFADLCTEVSQSLSDGKINDNELERIQREGGELVQKLQGLLAAAAAKNYADKPNLLRAI